MEAWEWAIAHDLAAMNPGGGAMSPPEQLLFVMCCKILFF